MKKKNIKSIALYLITLILLVFTVSCGGNGNDTNKNNKKIKVGLNGTESKAWEHIRAEASKKGIDLELLYFADYVQPNRALADKEIDINAFQTNIFLKEFNQKNNQNLIPVGTTYIAPMGIYSKKIKSLDELPNKAKVTIPNDGGSNEERALKLLEKSGLITLNKGDNKHANISDIAENPKQLEIIPMASNRLPSTLDEVDISVINNNFAIDAGFPLNVALFKEDGLVKDFINVIVARPDNKDDASVQEIVKLYQTEEVKKILAEDMKNNVIPTFVPLSEIGF